MRITSIRRFLLWTLLPAMVGVSAVVAVLTYIESAHEVEELFDAELAQSARVLAGLIDSELLYSRAEALATSLATGLGDATSEGTARHHYESKLSFQVLDMGGRLLFAAPGSPGEHLGPPVQGFAWVSHGGYRWRVFTLQNAQDGLWVQAAQRADIREELARDIAVDLLLQSLIAVPLLALAIPLIVAAAFRPVRRMARDVARREPGNLHPVDSTAAPAEIRSLVDALNALLRRLSLAFAAERRFTADAAHELRTPVAGLLVNADNALRATDDATRQASVRRVALGARRMQRLVDQLLTLSRLDPDAGLDEWHRVDLAAVAGEELAQFSELAEEKGVQLELLRDGRTTCTGNATMLGVLVRNLVDNALRHTPAGGRITVALRPVDGGVELAVTDTGPGIPAELRGRVLERFYRGSGGAEGSGLGLSIVRRIAEIHGAELCLDDAPGPPGAGGGLRVSVRFPVRIKPAGGAAHHAA